MLLSPKQMEFVKNANHRYNVKTGATRSGKSYMDNLYTIPSRIRERVGKDGLNAIIGVSKGTIERNVLEPMRELYGGNLVGSIGSNNIVNLFGDSVYCLGAEKVSQVAKLRGSSLKYVYGDEVAEWNEQVFDLLKSRLDKPYSCFDGACNPDNPHHWFKKFIDSDVDIYCQKYTIFDNPFLSKDFIENLCREYKGTVNYDRYIMGLWVAAEGMIYDIFGKSHVLDEFQNMVSEYYVSCDYGTQNATVFLLWQKRSDGVWCCIREYYYSGRDEDAQKTDNEYANDLEKWLGGIKIKKIIVDPSAASFIALLKKRGYIVKKAKNDVLDGIRFVATLLNQHKILFSSSCVNTIKEFNTYAWDTKASEDKPIKQNDHAMDAIRYFCYTIIRKPNNVGVLK